MLKGKSILVTGGAGFIGSHLVDEIALHQPEKLVVVSNFFLGKIANLALAKERFPELKVVNQDATEYEGMKKIVEENNTEVVFNLAGLPLTMYLQNPEQCFRHTANITLNVCELLRREKFKTLIHFSSSEAYGTAQEIPMSEKHPLRPETPYAAVKAAMDHLTLSYQRTFGHDLTIVRPFNNYGPRQNAGQHAAVIPLMIKKMLDGEEITITGDGEQTRDFIYVEDTAKATVEIYHNQNTRGKIINVSSGNETTINQIAFTLAKLCNYRKEFKYIPARKGDVRRHLGDPSLAKQLFGFNPETKIEDGLRKTVEWYQHEHQ